MKGLLLKDWYLMKKYCRMYLFLTVVFLVLSCIKRDNLFFSFYPCLLCGMIPVNLLSFDERSGWQHYSGTLPYTKAQIVSAKYLMGVFAMSAVLVMTGVVQTVWMCLEGAFQPEQLAAVLFAIFFLSLFFSAGCLPLIFRLGTEKGRVVSLVMVCLFFGGLFFVTTLFAGNFPDVSIPLELLLAGLALFGAGFYALSWRLSVAFYQKREL